MTTVEHKSLRETVTEALREMILSGELQAGERLVEDKLAERLAVSRNPIREAIRGLEAIGLVRVVPRHGAYVASIDADEALRIQEIRRVLESWIVEAAAERHDETDLKEIDRYLAVGAKASKARDLVKAAEAHRAFHLAIEAATKNEYVSVVMAPLRQRTELVFSVVDGRSRSPQQWEEHQAIRDAIAARDVKRAQALIGAHIHTAMEMFANPVGGGSDKPSTEGKKPRRS